MRHNIMKEHFKNAKEVVSKWPKWKREYAEENYNTSTKEEIEKHVKELDKLKFYRSE